MNSNKSNFPERIYYWDNLKTILIFLVVLGHFLIPVMTRGNSVLSIFYYIYLFHMPAFVFVSGVFSKKYIEKGAPQLNKLLGYLIIYILFKFALWLITSLYSGTYSQIDFLVEGSAPWYMLAMIIWLLILPVFVKLNFTTGTIFAFFIGTLLPMNDSLGNFLSMSRVIIFLPFFILGYYFQFEYVQKLKKVSYKVIALIILILTAIFVIIKLDFISRYSSLLYADHSYAYLQTSMGEALLLKIGWYLIAALMMFSLLVLCPERKFSFSYIGSRTLSIYIFHRLIREVFQNEHLYKYFDSNSILLICGCAIISIFIMLLFSEKHLSKFVNLPFKIIKKN